MGRVFLTIIVPLLLPTALYAAWRVVAGKRINIPKAWIWLAVAGIALASLTLVVISVDFGEPREGQYVPPHIGADGVVVPGHIESAPPSP